MIYSFFLKDKIIDFLKLKRRLKIQLKFYKGDVVNLKKKNFYTILPKKKFIFINLNLVKNQIQIKKKKLSFVENLKAEKIIMGTGLVPPKKLKKL